jgi:hypothetical protein
LYEYAGWYGGKVRTCRALAELGVDGLITASSRHSPQIGIVAGMGHALGLPVRVHVAIAMEYSPSIAYARSVAAEVIEHYPRYNSCIIYQANEDAKRFPSWGLIPFGMECEMAVTETSKQVANLPGGRRLVVPVGSAMTLCGVLAGLSLPGAPVYERVVGVMVGADPSKRMDAWGPVDWKQRVRLVDAGMPYHKPAADVMFRGIELDPYYEAKCVPFVAPGDTLWVVGIRTVSAT